MTKFIYVNTLLTIIGIGLVSLNIVMSTAIFIKTMDIDDKIKNTLNLPPPLYTPMSADSQIEEEDLQDDDGQVTSSSVVIDINPNLSLRELYNIFLRL